MSVCHNPARAAHEIADGARTITIPALTITWGKHDLRDDWTGAYTFCSFKCLADWATEKAAQHDGASLVEGAKPKRKR